MTTEAASALAPPHPDTFVPPGRTPGRPPRRARQPRPGAPAPTDAQLVRGDPPVTDLVAGATGGDQQAWDALVERYAPLIWSICRQYRLGPADADDAGQSVWLHLVDQLGQIREPAALAGWLATTTRRECGRLVRAAYTRLPPDGQRLIALLAADPLPYAQISAALGIPVGSIGPTRRRCLDKMRRHPALAALTGAEPGPPRPALAAAS